MHHHHPLIVIICLLLLASASASDLKLFELKNVEDQVLIDAEGDQVRIVGKVTATNVNKTGIHFLQFDQSDLVCVTFSQYLKNFTEGAPSELYLNQTVEVIGVIENYRDQPQIRLNDPFQIKILEAEQASAAEKEDSAREQEVDPEKSEETSSGDQGDASLFESKKLSKSDIITMPDSLFEVVTDRGPVKEKVDDLPALDWRDYFPE